MDRAALAPWGVISATSLHRTHVQDGETFAPCPSPSIVLMECEGASILQLIENRHFHTLLAEAGHRYQPQTPGTFLIVSPKFVLPSQYLV